MKTILFKTILALTLVLIALPMTGQDYLKLYFKDGHTERHFMNLVKEISATRYDLEGNLHSDYQMQQIVMEDTTYSYYIEDIDSMTFRKVDEEQVKSRVASVQSSLEHISQQCSNIEDLASHIDEIKRIDGIEEVYYDGNDLFIQILDWFVISVIRQPIPEDIKSSVNTSERHNEKALKPTTKNGTPMKVNIGFQMKDDFYFVDSKVEIDLLNTKFSIMGFTPNYNIGDELDFDYFYKRIFDSNVLLINTHGGCGIFNKKHYLFTGIESSSNDFVGLNIDRWFNISKNIDIDDIGITTCNYTGGNLFNNPFGFRWYFTVTEDYIRKSPYRFTGAGPHIVFVAACSSLQGNDLLTRSDGKQYYGSDSFAQVFFDKGADVYLGYNRGSYRSGFAAASFLNYMIHGASVEQAYNSLHPLYKFEEDKDEQAALIDLYNRNSKNPKGIFIVNTHTVTKTDLELNEEFASNQHVKLSGTTSCWYLEDMHPQFGIKVATESNIDESTYGEEIMSNDFYYSGGEYKEVVFSAMFKPEPDIKYYYRAFTYDGIHYNWGEERSFKAPEFPHLSLSSSTLKVESGTSCTVDITSGSGSYSIDKIEPEGVVTVSIRENQIFIEALEAGTATITVKDDKSGETTNIEVAVTDPVSYPSCPDGNHPHMIDLGLPSGKKWACCNMGSATPDDYGGWYAWGETEEKNDYTWKTYSHCDGSEGTCHDLGKSICGTKFDVAHENWDVPWQMPSRTDMQELINNCTHSVITLNGVNGMEFIGSNGRSIFMPFAGSRDGTEQVRQDTHGYYWTGTPSNDKSYDSYFVYIGIDGSATCYRNGKRKTGLTIRPIMQDPPVIAEAIDLGLPSGTKWASHNIGANKPEDFGQYFAWGETEPKDWYSWGTYEHCDGTKETCHDIGAEISGTKYDVARYLWGEPWRMPTATQIDELVDNCKHELTTYNGVTCMKVTGPNGKFIYLPCAGFMSGDTLYHLGEYGLYKSGSRCGDDIRQSWLLNSDADGFVRIGIWNSTGHTVRPVQGEAY